MGKLYNVKSKKASDFLFVVGVVFGNTISKKGWNDLGIKPVFSDVIWVGKISKIKTCITNLTD